MTSEDKKRECGLDLMRDGGKAYLTCRMSDACGPYNGKLGKPDLTFEIKYNRDGGIVFPSNFKCMRACKPPE